MEVKSIEPNIIENQNFNPISLLWKDEDEDEEGESFGPLYYVDANGGTLNFEDSSGTDQPENRSAQWLSLTEAERIAEKLGFELETF